MSRSQKEAYPSNVKHDNLDLTQDPKGMAKQLQGVEGEDVFFAAYLQKDNEQENWDVNGKIRLDHRTKSKPHMVFHLQGNAQELP